MAKQGQHHGDANDGDVSRSNNNPSKTTEITTGSVQKKKNREQATREGRSNDGPAQEQGNETITDTRSHTSERRAEDGPERSGSDSNPS